MFASFQKIIPSHKKTLHIVYGLILAWLGFFAWMLAWPLTWASIPVLLCLGYFVFRLIFELTLNRATVPTLATCFVARQKIAKFLQHEAAGCNQENYIIVDLGSGRGELTRTIAKRIPKAKVIGIEMARFPYRQASLIQRWFGPSNLSYERRDFWLFDCSMIDAVVLYLGPITVQRMGDKLQRELKQGSLVISHTYPLLGEWSPTDVLTFYSPFKETFYVYRKLELLDRRPVG